MQWTKSSLKSVTIPHKYVPSSSLRHFYRLSFTLTDPALQPPVPVCQTAAALSVFIKKLAPHLALLRTQDIQVTGKPSPEGLECLPDV